MQDNHSTQSMLSFLGGPQSLINSFLTASWLTKQVTADVDCRTLVTDFTVDCGSRGCIYDCLSLGLPLTI